MSGKQTNVFWTKFRGKKAEKYLKVPFVMNKSQGVVKLVLYVKYV